MLITHEREKLIQAIIFFTKHTRKCGKIKLFKLLYFLDFEHFKRTGRSVTGLNYFAWPMGPVPVSLYEEIDAPEADLAEAIRFEEKTLADGERKMLTMNPLRQFSREHFSKREFSIMQSLASEYRSAAADSMIEATHLENLPWHKVYKEQGLPQAIIPYELAVRPDELEAVMRIANDRKELIESLR